MLPVLGLLRTYPCPHAVAGLCARPNCFYSHRKTDIQHARRKGNHPQLAHTNTKPVQSIPDTETDNNNSKPSDLPEPPPEHERKPGPSVDKQKGIKRKSNESESGSSIAVDEIITEEKRNKSPIKQETAADDDGFGSKRSKSSTSPEKVTRKEKLQKSESEFGNRKDRINGQKYQKIENQDDEKVESSTFDKLVLKKRKSLEESTLDNSVVKDEEFDFMVPESEEDDPDQIALECLQMFNNYKPKEPEEGIVESKVGRPAADVEKEEEIVRNKRVAHSGAAAKPKFESPSPHQKKYPPRLSATEAMLQRYESAKQQGLVVNTEQKQKSPTRPASAAAATEGKKRIAHVANVSGLIKPAAIERKLTTTTVAHTAIKGETRLAHIPKQIESTFPAPKIPWESAKTSKIPVVVRQKILDQLFQECRKIYDQPEDAAKRALAEEKELSTRCSAKSVYICSGTNAVGRLRKEVNTDPTAGSSKSGAAISHMSVIAGASGARNSWSIESVKKMSWPPPGPLLYIGLTRYLLTEEQLVSNSFPRKSPDGGGRAVLVPRVSSKGKVDLETHPFLRICDRCTKSYKVDPDGYPVVVEKCVFHHGRKFKRKVNGIIEGRYTCCDGDVSAEGCSLSDYHVSTQSSNQLRGFVTAIKDAGGDDEVMGSDPWDIIALDCEMIYTTHGNELARVTIIGSTKEVLYDVFVKPIHPVLDYNTKFSGITEEMLQTAAARTLTDVQAVLLTRLKPNTIIIGHSLENDLLALKLIHSTVVDTSVLFPHRLGPPLKRALRNLTTECLGKIIQMGEGGHDSAEDARSALELALWKLKEDSKLQDCFSKIN